MKTKIYFNDKIEIYLKSGAFEIGDEADLADEVFMAAIEGYIEFAKHLKNPKPFWKNTKFAMEQVIKDAEKELKDY